MTYSRIATLTAVLHALLASCTFLASAQTATSTTLTAKDHRMLKHESVTAKTFDGFPLNIDLIYNSAARIAKRPVILVVGGAPTVDKMQPWASGLVDEGYLYAAFTPARPPDPDSARRPIFLYFDERFAHSYASMGYFAPRDAQTVVDYFKTRKDVDIDKIGWVGASSTGIPGLAVATQGPRLAGVVAFVATGAYEQWIQTWHTHGLWKGKTNDLWPETKALFKYDPIRHVEKMFPTAILMVSGGADKVVDAKTALAFVRAAEPYYKSDPDRLRLVVYEEKGHNLPADVVKMYVENWFHLYVSTTSPAPKSKNAESAPLAEQVKNTQITGADHKKLTGSK